MKGSLECAVYSTARETWGGANCNVVLRLRGTVPGTVPMMLMQSMGLDNKSALQLINIVNKLELNQSCCEAGHVKRRQDQVCPLH